MNEVLIQIKDLNAGYNGKSVIQAISLTIYRQDFLGIIGPNGGGKTTLIKTILGLIKPFSGEIIFNRKDLKKRMGYMPQTNSLDKKFPILVREVIESGLVSEKSLNNSDKKEKVSRILHEMGIEDIAQKPIGELSGGQWQRTLLGRAIINDPELLILDEPNSYIDKRFENHFYRLLQRINEKTAIVLVSHDIGTMISNVKNIACVDGTLHYHSGNDVDGSWLDEHLGCPFEILGHGDIPHRILKKH